jgi:antirestriction protein ArdC
MQRQAVPTQEALATAFERIVCAEDYLKFLDFKRSFPTYSLANTALIWSQKQDATFVCGYRQWQKNHNRQVKRGEHGLLINVPVPFTRKEVEEDPRRQGQLKGFTQGFVFDVSQTHGDPIPQASHTAPNTTSAPHHYAFAEAVAEDVTGSPIELEDLSPGHFGYWQPSTGSITINRDHYNTIAGAATLYHEAAHHADIATLGNPGATTKPSREYILNELVAESVAYLITTTLDIPDTRPQATEYIREYAQGDMAIVKDALPRAFDAYKVISTRIDNLATITGATP